MANPLGSIFSSSIIPPSQQHLMDPSLFPLGNPPESYFLHLMFASASDADSDTISIHSPPESPNSSSESASSPYEDYRRSVPEGSDQLYTSGGGIDGLGLDEETLNLGFEEETSVGEKRMRENRRPIEEALKTARVSEGGSGAIEVDDDREVDNEVTEEYDNDEDEVYCYYCADDEGNGNKEEIGMLLKILAYCWQERSVKRTRLLTCW